MSPKTAQSESVAGTILAVVTTIAGLIVGLGIISSIQEGLIVSITTGAIAAAAVIANAIHTNSINPTAIETAVLAVAAQVVALLVSFGIVESTATGSIIAVVSAVVIAAATIAHALIAKQLSREGALSFTHTYHVGTVETRQTPSDQRKKLEGGSKS